MHRPGQNVSARQIGTVRNAHPAALGSAAHAVRSEMGEDEIKACVVLSPAADLSAGELHTYCRGRMARYAIGRHL